MMPMTAIVALAVVTYGLRLTGPLLRGRVTVPAAAERLFADAATVLDTSDQMQGLATQVPIAISPPALSTPPLLELNEHSTLQFSGGNAIQLTDTAAAGNNNVLFTSCLVHRWCGEAGRR